MKKKRLNKKNLLLFLMFIFFLVLFIISGIKIVNYIKDNRANEKIKKDINSSIKINEKATKDKYIIDFKALKEQNSDTVGYIKVNGTNIEYAVVKGTNNAYYLNHNFNNDWNGSGWIFADYRNKFDGTDKNIVIYGHSMRDKSMFGTLKYVLNKDWYENKDNHIIILVTETGTHYYKVFSTYSISKEDYYITTDFISNEDFGTFINKIKSRSIYSYGVSVGDNERILTLSSCIGDTSKRVVLHAKLITDYKGEL